MGFFDLGGLCPGVYVRTIDRRWVRPSMRSRCRSVQFSLHDAAACNSSWLQGGRIAAAAVMLEALLLRGYDSSSSSSSMTRAALVADSWMSTVRLHVKTFVVIRLMSSHDKRRKYIVALLRVTLTFVTYFSIDRISFPWQVETTGVTKTLVMDDQMEFVKNFRLFIFYVEI